MRYRGAFDLEDDGEVFVSVSVDDAEAEVMVWQEDPEDWRQGGGDGMLTVSGTVAQLRTLATDLLAKLPEPAELPDAEAEAWMVRHGYGEGAGE